MSPRICRIRSSLSTSYALERWKVQIETFRKVGVKMGIESYSWRGEGSMFNYALVSWFLPLNYTKLCNRKYARESSEASNAYF